LGSTRWARTKKKVRESVVSLAGELIKLYAARSVANGYAFEHFNSEDEAFADGFPYDETADQLSAIEETLADMTKQTPMDRLVCGDVGFGKTEVALRAAFKSVQESRQVAVLVPTTVLVEQHYRTFLNRFIGYPIRVGAVSRFYKPAENKATLEQVANGQIDIVIGTHRLLSKDVNFKNLGVLIIDEEHRFGVKQKERLKQMRTSVDVLTLTATPIPRTLHMSMLGVRDISLISTPPTDRRVIKTYITNRDDTLIRDAILREIRRGGQVFFLHNRVQNIDIVTAGLCELVPEARFQFGHGQMSEKELEKIMLDFVDRKFDILVSTTIIESGLDIPNANTILIDRADTFGLAQLYQLRGRVGRSDRQAFCYLLIPNSRSLNVEAEKRLQALQSLDDLGLGFNLAMRDLEIRGAGNLLGKEQSGNVIAVGFDLYTKILKEAVLNLSGKELDLEQTIDPEVKIPINAYLPEPYIPDVSERLVLYQRLSTLSSSEEADKIRVEMEDRFGPLSSEAMNLLGIMRIRSLLKHFGVVRFEATGSKYVLSFSQRASVDPQKIIELVQKEPARYSFSKSYVLSVTRGREASDDPGLLYD
ncbi:MAG: transcription-repair coupling factor, partial [Bdellovibrionales bacterium]|nr:transcription-repair coupling factor [Bdellovibrionales bacterium]